MALVVSSTSGVRVLSVPRSQDVIVGRDDECDVVIADDSVSRRHARLSLTGEEMWVEDLGSTNGTRVQGVRVKKGQRVPLVLGAVFDLGSTSVVLQRTRSMSPAGSGHEDAAATSHGSGIQEVRARSTNTNEAPEHVVVDPAMSRLLALVHNVAPTPLSVLILGETGVGKEAMARAVHDGSRRRGPYLQVNCAALPESILDGELFGYEKGAFTGATQSRPGLFEAADGGTLFLDEVGELPLGTQAKLLRVLESGDVLRLGARKALHVDVRFVSATNRDLASAVRQGTFRADLFFRLNGLSVVVPPLRRRKADVLPLAQHFLERACRAQGKSVPTLSAEAKLQLTAHTWPGNVRELRNTMDRAAALAAGASLTVEDLSFQEASLEVSDGSGTYPLPTEERLPQPGDSIPSRSPSSPSLEGTFVATTAPPPAAGTSPPVVGVPPVGPAPSFREEADRMKDALRNLERQRIVEALEKAAGNQSQAARILGISRYALIHRLETFGLARPRKGQS